MTQPPLDDAIRRAYASLPPGTPDHVAVITIASQLGITQDQVRAVLGIDPQPIVVPDGPPPPVDPGPPPDPHGYWQGPPKPMTAWFHLGMQPEDQKT